MRQAKRIMFMAIVALGAVPGAFPPLPGAGEAAAQTSSSALRHCLTSRAMREAVAGRNVIAPAAAVMTARRLEPGADVVRANLCHSPGGLVYVIMVLRKDGRLVQVTIEAASGRVMAAP